MKKLYYVLAIVLLASCATVNKMTLPFLSGKIGWEVEVPISNKSLTYQKIIQYVSLKYIPRKIRTQDKDNGIITVVDNSDYLYKGKKRNMNYTLYFIIKENTCFIRVSDIFIRHHDLELLYTQYQEKRKEIKKLSEAFESIKEQSKIILDTMQKEIFEGE